MTDIKFIEKTPICLGALAEEVKKAAEDKENPITLQQRVKDYAINFSKLNKEKELKLLKAIKDLEIPLLTDSHMVEIINLMPENLPELRTIFAGSKTTITLENLTKILEVLKTK